MIKKFAFFAATVLLAISCTKQDQVAPEAQADSETEMVGGRQCASTEILEQQIAADPARGRFLEELEFKTERFIADRAAQRGAGVLHVPVVVHIVSTNPNQVTTAHIQSQIDVLNADFGKTNSELANSSIYLAGYSLSNVANCEIVFDLDQTIRKTTTVATFGTNDAVKKTAQGGSDAVSPTTKLNLWVCDLSGGLLGYAQFPGGPSVTDGVVIDYQGFGTSAASSYPLYAAFNKGRTATHEVGHWFNLRHIWGDARCGNDFVADTPLHDASNGGCPSVGTKTKCPGKPLEQWMNYMDYTNDACMYMFTGGQKSRMDAAIDAARRTYVY